MDEDDKSLIDIGLAMISEDIRTFPPKPRDKDYEKIVNQLRDLMMEVIDMKNRK